jgi:hypothetical protein
MSRIPHRLQIIPLLKLLLALSFALASVYVASGRFMPVVPGSLARQQESPTKKTTADVSTPADKGSLSKKTSRSVALSVDKTLVFVNEPVQFTVTINGFRGMIYGGCRWSYLLFFGDGFHQPALLSCDRHKKFPHRYSRTGDFVAKVVNLTSDCTGVITQPDPVTVTVQEPKSTPAQTPKSAASTVTQSPSPTTDQSPSPEPTNSTTESPSPKATDQSPSPEPTNRTTESPSPKTTDGFPSPKPEETPYARTGPLAVVSPTIVPSPSPRHTIEVAVIVLSPTASPSSTPTASGWVDFRKHWGRYLLLILALIIIALLASFTGYRTLRRAPAVRPTLYLHRPDPGTPDFKGGTKNFAISFELLLNPKVTEGQSHIITSEARLIRSERRDDG